MQYLNPTDLASAYTDAQAAGRKAWLKYDEYERLANGEVRTDLPGNMPKVNDNSLSATIKKIPKRLFAKPMTGTVSAEDRGEDWIADLVNILVERRIIPNANTDATFLRKWKVAVRNSKVYGAQPIYCFFTQHGTYTGADFNLPYVRNVYLEPGAISDLASDYIFMDTYYTKLKAKRLVDKALEDFKALEAGDLEETDVQWDYMKLKAWYDAGPSGKDSQNMTSKERVGENRNEKGLYKLVTCFNRGYQAPFYTFAPNIADQVVGTQENTNPTGDLPIIYLYDDEDLINPYGQGLVQAAGATQNVLDNLTQTDVLATQIGNQPPIDINGDRSQTNLKSLVYAPNAFWFTGNAKVNPVLAVNPTMYNAMPARFGLYKSQLQFQTGTFDNSVSAESGNPGFSKTDAGVKELANQTNADDNDSQQSIADAYKRVMRTLINIHMNNMEGTELLALEGDEIDRMAKTELLPVDPTTGKPDTTEIELVWENLRGTFDYNVDPESSILKDKTGDIEQVTQLIQMAASNPELSMMLQASGWKFDMGEAYAEVFNSLGIKNIDKILVKITPEEQAEMEQGMVDPATGMPMAPEPGMEQEMPMEEQAPQPGQQDVRAIMEQYGVDPDTAAGIAAAMDNGLTAEDYLNYINQPQAVA